VSSLFWYCPQTVYISFSRSPELHLHFHRKVSRDNPFADVSSSILLFAHTMSQPHFPNPRNRTSSTPGAAPWGLVLQPTPALPQVHAGGSPQMLPVGAQASIPSIQAAISGPPPTTAIVSCDGGLMMPGYAAYAATSTLGSAPVPIPAPNARRVNSGGHFEQWNPDPAFLHAGQIPPTSGATNVMAAGMAARKSNNSDFDLLMLVYILT
jgi:hypothetical protein